MSDNFTIVQGDCISVMRSMPDCSVDAVITDPPYELGFMGKDWDSTGIAFNPQVWREALRVLKPGGHLLSFGGSRTYHRMACAIEDAGFEIRDQIMWVYGSGFPKSHNISKAMDKQGKTDDKWDGWGTALKPAHEPICLARKPLEGTVVDNVRKWGVGGLNIDGCRVEFVSEEDRQESVQKNQHADFGSTMGSNQVYGDYSMLKPQNYAPKGRFPANLIHDGSPEVLELFPNTAPSKKSKRGSPPHYSGNIMKDLEQRGHDDCGGSAARFFYCPKASKADRDEGCEGMEEKRESDRTKDNGAGGDNPRNRTNNPRKNHHPTVKPTELMRYLCRLITPNGGKVLDPFNGSGSTGKAALLEGLSYVGIELNPEYIEIAKARLTEVSKQILNK